MKIINTSLDGVFYFEPAVFGDERGFFMESYRKSWFGDLGLDIDFVQDNHSKSRKGILRGLHYQIQQPQGKLVRVIHGEVYDVAVDLRKGSKSFGKWVGVNLSSENNRIMWVPPGFAHGFYVVSDTAEFLYKCTTYYAPEHERTLLWNDDSLDIDWPLHLGGEPLLSDKDREGRSFDEADVFVGL